MKQMRTDSVIRVENLSHCYPGGVKALLPTSLEFYAGEFTVLLGPSGAGKSTLLRCLNLLNPTCSGKVMVEGLGVVKNRQTIRTHRLRTGMVFQQHQLIGRYTALDNVLMARLGYHSLLRSLFPLPRKDRLLALECLHQVGLAHKALERIDHLSGGEQQRVGIARALAQEPRMILADEPVASVDPATAELVLSLLHRIAQAKKLTVIVSLHQIDFARKFADRVIGLSRGRVVFDGTVAQLTPAAVDGIYARPSDGSHKERTPTQESAGTFVTLSPMQEQEI